MYIALATRARPSGAMKTAENAAMRGQEPATHGVVCQLHVSNDVQCSVPLQLLNVLLDHLKFVL